MAETTNTVIKDSILFGIIGFLLGVVITILFARNAVNNDMQGMMRMMGMHSRNESMMENRTETLQTHGGGMDMSMNDMMTTLERKTGDDFDEAFISEMIIHHQGAIDMATLAKTSAKHQEIKDLASDIIGAQTKEIEMMREWQRIWGY